MSHEHTSTMWMRTPGQTWPGVAASFLGMWIVMMVVMMLPSLIPMLGRYRRAVGGTGEPRLTLLTATVTVGYFFIWTIVGAGVFPLGAGVSAIAMRYTVRVSRFIGVVLVASVRTALPLRNWCRV